jgi:hypothetical protein
MALYGKALANQIPSSVTGNQARLGFGAMTSALQGAYQTLASYDLGGIGEWSGLDAGSVAAARQYLDSTNEMLQGYFADMPISDAPLSEHQLQEFKTSASTSSVAVKTIDDLFSTSWLGDLCDALIAAIGTVTSAVANAVSKVAGSFIGGTWWIWILVGLGMWGWRKWQHSAVRP